MASTDIVQLFLPLLFCGDEISDILYLILNWDSFACIELRNASLAFVLINGIINFFCAIVIAFRVKGLKNASKIKILALICFCGWVPVLAIVYILLYFKFIDLTIKWSKADALLEDVSKITMISQGLHYCQLFLEDIPQLIIQPINNTQAGKWSVIQYISLAFTVGVILYEILHFMFCRGESPDVSNPSEEAQYKQPKMEKTHEERLPREEDRSFSMQKFHHTSPTRPSPRPPLPLVYKIEMPQSYNTTYHTPSFKGKHPTYY